MDEIKKLLKKIKTIFYIFMAVLMGLIFLTAILVLLALR